MGRRITRMELDGKPLDPAKSYKVAGWAPVSEDARAAGGEAIWDVFARYLQGPHRPTDVEAAEAASLVRRLRPLAQQTVDAELARAMRTLAARHLRQHLGSEETPDGRQTSRSVSVPEETMRAVERLVGVERAAEFFVLAAEREVRARALDALTSNGRPPVDLDEEG
jgi:hypothetical protein